MIRIRDMDVLDTVWRGRAGRLALSTVLILTLSTLSVGCLVEDGGGDEGDDTGQGADTGVADTMVEDTGEDDDTTEPADTGTDAGDTELDTDADSEDPSDDARYVQDHWVYERIRTYDDQGNIVDLSQPIKDHFSGAPDRAVSLSGDVEFQVYEDLSPPMVDVSGEVRNDVDVVAGFVDGPNGRALAAVATPEVGASGPIRAGDRIRMDLTFLSDQVSVGDALLLDISFLQGIPSSDPADEQGLGGLELLATRIQEDRAHFYATSSDSDAPTSMFDRQVGYVVAPVGTQSFNSGTEPMNNHGGYGDMPAKADPMLDGMRDSGKECGQGLLEGETSLDCVSDWWGDDGFGGGAKDSAEQIYGCNLEPGGCDDPPPDNNPRCIGDCGSSSNDPHIVTLDGTGYDLQLVGEFVAAKSDAMEVQLRFGPWRRCPTDTCDSSRTVSVTTAAAIEVDGHVVNVFRAWDELEDRQVHIDGTPTAIADLRGDGMDIGGANVRRAGGSIVVESPAGDRVYIDTKWSRLDVYVEPADQQGNWSGIFGDHDGDDTNDIRLRDGTVLQEPVDRQTLYGQYGDDWRLSNSESLFKYPQGEDTETYTDMSFPDEIVTVDTLSQEERDRAEAICRSVGIVGEFALNSCILDYAVTGDIGMVASARLLDVVEGIRVGARRPDGTLINEDCTNYETCVVQACDLEAVDVQGNQQPNPDGSLSHYCPPGCEDRSGRSVWGTDIYTDDSSICRAAVHDGAIGDRGGLVKFWIVEGQDSYEATTRNGVESKSWGSWGGSFVFQQEWSCNDNADNDEDGDTDCADSDCSEECR